MVSSGASLAVIGDVSQLEVLIEMLSTDAVKVQVGSVSVSATSEPYG